MSYQHIGHNPRHGPVVIWSLDHEGTVHEDRRSQGEPDPSWIDWSHENCFREVKARAVGRVELQNRAGSIHISDPELLRSEVKLCRVLDALDRRFPQTRWFVFGPGCNGATIAELLAKAA
ncbi:MAG: hypothetical protein AB7Q91_14590 [Phycisphaerales bacterium]